MIEGATVLDWNVSIIQPPSEAPAGVPCTIRVVSSASSLSNNNEDSESPKYVYPIQYIRDVAYPAWCPTQRWQMLQSNMELKSSDVLVVSYPKCGTTWAEQCSLLLSHNCDVSKMNPASKNVHVPNQSHIGKIWPEACIEQNPQVHLKTGLEFVPITMDEFDAAPSPRILKSHAPPNLLLSGKGTPSEGGFSHLPPGIKVVVVTRNPLDACVSSYYHAWNPSKSGWPFSAWAAAWLSGNVPHGCWFEWVKNWHREATAHPDRVLWVQYEDLKADAFATTQRVAQFINPALGSDSSLIERVVAASSFESMREQAAGSDSGAAAGHLRKGVAGDWRNHFSEQLKDEFAGRYREKLAGTGIVYSLGAGEGTMEA